MLSMPACCLGCFSDTSKNLKRLAVFKLEFLNHDLSPMVLSEKKSHFVCSLSCNSASPSFDGCARQRSCLQMFAYLQHKPVLS